LDGECLHEIVRACALREPDRVAVSAGGAQISYRDLDASAELAAAGLRAGGVGPGVLVGLAASRGLPLVIAMLAILKAGGAYLPVDPAYPDERLRLLIADSGIRLLVSDGQAADRVAAAAGAAGAELVSLDVLAAAGRDQRARPPASAGPGDLAYVIYTSGSTGQPKGVAVEHRNVVRLFTSTRRCFGFSERDVWTMFHSPSFDFSVWEIWGALLHGGRLVIVPPQATRVPAELLRLVRAEGVTVLSQTPSAFRQLIAADGGAGADGGVPAGGAGLAGLPLRLVVFGGERLDVAMLRPWLRRHGEDQPRLVNMYGITETTVHVTFRRIRAADLSQPEVSPIGVPLPDLRVTLHDEAGAEVADGSAGEIWVSGPGLARGYLGRPELTAQRFSTGPDGVRYYHSGDRAVRDSHGELAYLGRLDDQIKVRGFRIEPGEVEACLAAYPGVAGLAVTVADFGGGDNRLVACVQPSAAGIASGEQRLTAQLRQHAAAALPAHLCPSAYVLVAELPVTAQGKLDRTALASTALAGTALNGAAKDGGGAGAGERADEAGVITGIVEEVLGQPGIAPDADIFDLGATSLALVRIITQLNARFGVRLTGSELGDTASVAALTAAVDSARRVPALGSA
jgi:amino acid adenylation domain-containing protein